MALRSAYDGTGCGTRKRGKATVWEEVGKKGWLDGMIDEEVCDEQRWKRRGLEGG